MSEELYTHTFTWPATPSQSVIVTGTFDNWSGSTHNLTRASDSTAWSGQVKIPFGERIAYKYVVDGNWLIREDEAKEWDAAGNMNNIFSAPSKADAEALKQKQASAATQGSSVAPKSATTEAAAVGAGAGALAGAGAVGAHQAGVSTTAVPTSASTTSSKAAMPGTLGLGEPISGSKGEFVDSLTSAKQQDL